jgi:hypothetical protein
MLRATALPAYGPDLQHVWRSAQRIPQYSCVDALRKLQCDNLVGRRCTLGRSADGIRNCVRTAMVMRSIRTKCVRFRSCRFAARLWRVLYNPARRAVTGSHVGKRVVDVTLQLLERPLRRGPTPEHMVWSTIPRLASVANRHNGGATCGYI